MLSPARAVGSLENYCQARAQMAIKKKHLHGLTSPLLVYQLCTIYYSLTSPALGRDKIMTVTLITSEDFHILCACVKSTNGSVIVKLGKRSVGIRKQIAMPWSADLYRVNDILTTLQGIDK